MPVPKKIKGHINDLCKRTGRLLFWSAATAMFSQTAIAACTYTIDSEWNSGFVASITIKNDTTSAVNGWNVNWQYATNRITGSWNTNLAGTNPYAASNVSWNGSLAPGQSVSFGFQGNKNGATAERPQVNGALCGTASSSVSSVASSTPVVSSSVRSSSSSARSSSSSSSVSSQKKFVGNITTSGAVRSDFITYWNQITPENEGKWGSVEATRDVYNWAPVDRIYAYARQHNIPVKAHTFVWGAQSPSWINNLSASETAAEIEEWIRDYCTRYPDTAMIDVVNEAVVGHQPAAYAEKAFGSNWIQRVFQLARQYCPNSILILNDYNNIRWQHNEFIALAKAQGNYIDAVGLQAHELKGLTAEQVKTAIDNIWNQVGKPIYISEYDIGDTNDQVQLQNFQAHFPVFWEHPHVKGITLWGYVAGKTWIEGSGLIQENGTPRPAMTWLRNYLATASSSSSSSAASSSGYVVPANNFAQNGGAESGLTSWGSTAATVTRSTAEKRSGSASVLISGRTAAWHGLTFNVGALTLGNQYDVAVWVKLAAGTPDSVITLTAKRQDDSDTTTYNEYTRVATMTASANEWRLLQGYYTHTGSTAFQHFIIEATDANISYYADDFSIGGEVTQQTCELTAPLQWTATAPLISPKNSGWVSIKDPSVVKYNGTYHVYATYYDTAYKSMYTSFTDWNNAQSAAHISMNGSTVGNTVAPQVFYFRPHNKWYLITQWPGTYATTDDIRNPNWTAKKKLLQGEPEGALDFWVICNDTHCYLYFSRDDGVLYVSKTTIGNFPNFSGYSVVMEDHRGNGNQYLFEAPNVYKLDGQNKYLLMVEAWPSGPRMFRSWTSTSLDGPWTPLADTDANPFAGNNNVEWPTGKWANGISHGELIRSGYDERLTVDPCNLEFLYQGEAGPSPDGNYNTIPYKLGLLRLKK